MIYSLEKSKKESWNQLKSQRNIHENDDDAYVRYRWRLWGKIMLFSRFTSYSCRIVRTNIRDQRKSYQEFFNVPSRTGGSQSVSAISQIFRGHYTSSIDGTTNYWLILSDRRLPRWDDLRDELVVTQKSCIVIFFILLKSRASWSSLERRCHGFWILRQSSQHHCKKSSNSSSNRFFFGKTTTAYNVI